MKKLVSMKRLAMVTAVAGVGLAVGLTAMGPASASRLPQWKSTPITALPPDTSIKFHTPITATPSTAVPVRTPITIEPPTVTIRPRTPITIEPPVTVPVRKPITIDPPVTVTPRTVVTAPTQSLPKTAIRPVQKAAGASSDTATDVSTSGIADVEIGTACVIVRNGPSIDC